MAGILWWHVFVKTMHEVGLLRYKAIDRLENDVVAVATT